MWPYLAWHVCHSVHALTAWSTKPQLAHCFGVVFGACAAKLLCQDEIGGGGAWPAQGPVHVRGLAWPLRWPRSCKCNGPCHLCELFTDH